MIVVNVKNYSNLIKQSLWGRGKMSNIVLEKIGKCGNYKFVVKEISEGSFYRYFLKLDTNTEIELSKIYNIIIENDIIDLDNMAIELDITRDETVNIINILNKEKLSIIKNKNNSKTVFIVEDDFYGEEFEILRLSLSDSV